MRIRPATVIDIPAILELERGCASAAHWSESQYQIALSGSESGGSGRQVLVVVRDNQAESSSGFIGTCELVAFLVANNLGPEWELENVVVASSARRKGLAERLLGELVARARLSQSEAVFLEVRESNQSARALYRKLGFGEIGRRKGYYAGPTEDAILCRLTVS